MGDCDEFDYKKSMRHKNTQDFKAIRRMSVTKQDYATAENTPASAGQMHLIQKKPFQSSIMEVEEFNPPK